MKKILTIAVVLLGAGLALAGCSSKKIYTEEEITQIHDITSVVEQRQTAFYNVVTNSIPGRLEQLAQENGGIAAFTSTRKLDASKPMLALTFNGGPDTEITEKLLDVLQENQAHATFFIDPDKLDESTAPLLKRMRRMGCEVGFYITGGYFAFALCLYIDCFRSFSVEFSSKSLDAEDNLCDILFHTRNC